MKTICIDTCFLLGVYDSTDQYHTKALQYFRDYFESKPNAIFIPWPILYETISTRFVKNKVGLAELMQDWVKLNSQKRLILCDDSKYREKALEEYNKELEREYNKTYRDLSLTDRVIRNILRESSSLRINAFITFNERDFTDICRLTRCEMIL